MRRALAGCLALVAASCGLIGGDPLAAASDSLRDVRSGILDLRMVAETEGGRETGFFVRGVFSTREDELPVADLAYGRIGVRDAPETGFVSTGDAAYAVVDGRAYELPPEGVEGPFGAAEPAAEGPFGELDLATWVRDPEVSNGPPVDANGVESVVVEGDLDVVAAMNDLLGVARATAGLTLPPIEGDEARRLEAAVEEATLRVVTDHDDRFRRLEIAVRLGAGAPAALSDPLAALLGVSFELQVSIDEPNEDLIVRPPPERGRTTSRCPAAGVSPGLAGARRANLNPRFPPCS